MQAHYDKLIGDFCTLINVADPAEIAALGKGRPIDIDDITFTFGYNEAQAPDRLLVFCDFGPVPQDSQAAVYRALLETNLYLYENDLAVFSILPNTGRALCATRFSVAGMGGQELLGMVTYLAERAHEWRRSHFDVAIRPLHAGGGRRKHIVGDELRSQLRPS